MTKVAVFGGLNTDLIASKVKRLLGRGDQTSGKELKIGPGGKSGNIARMIAVQLGPNKVAFVGKTSKDPFGLWKVPLKALTQAGVSTKYIKQLDFVTAKKYPGVAMIPVDVQGDNQVYVLPGINEDFSPADVESAETLFEEVGHNSGIAALSLEMPWRTAMHIFDKAREFKLRIFLDPGGTRGQFDCAALLKKEIFLIKPNEHEAEELTGIKVTNMKSAEKAAQKLRSGSIENVLITHGERGAYLFTPSGSGHIPVPKIRSISKEKDSTGCGDQTMATLCAAMVQGADIFDAAKLAVLSGTLQFYNVGVEPVANEEIQRYST